MLKVLLIALAVAALVVFLVARTDIAKVGFRVLRKGEPDRATGVIAIVFCAAVLLFLFMPREKESTTPGVDIALRMWAFLGLAWGIRQFRKAKSRTKQSKDKSGGVLRKRSG